MHRRTLLALVAGTATLAAGGFTWRAFSHDLSSARARTRNRSVLVTTSAGTLEYAEAGSGPAVMMVHGTGGGFDQGLLFAEPLVGRGWRVLAPSRFGYLRSSFPRDPSPAMQADSFAVLLDTLRIERTPIIGGSAGAQSALEFAIRHPDRCSALVAVVPAAFAPGRPPVKPPNAVAHGIIAFGLRSDFLFWAAMSLNEDAMIAALLATDPRLVHGADPDERARARAILHGILPVSDKAEGLLNDAHYASDPKQMDLGAIGAPTLAISLADDRFQTLAAAEHIARSVPGAALVSYPTGGHIWIGHNSEIFTEIDEFLRTALDVTQNKPQGSMGINCPQN